MMDAHIREQLDSEGSQLERRLLDFCHKRLEAAERRWSQRHHRWRESERLYRAFRSPDDQDRQTRDDELTKGVEKIVVPYSYAVIQSTLAFFMTVFTSRKPLIPVEGRGPSDVRAAMLMEVALDHQFDRMEPTGLLVFYQWLLDSLRYGVGIIKNVWTIREFPDLIRQTSPILDPFTGQPAGYQDHLIERDVVDYEGNEALNVSPFDWLPDPRRPMAEFQKGEFVAHRMKRSWTELEQREAEGLYAGIEHIPRTQQDATFGGYSASGSEGQSDLSRIVEMDDFDNLSLDENSKPYVDIHELWAFVHPEMLGLSEDESRTPRLWVFTIANKARVIRAEAANLPGHRFPFEIVELNYDVHSPSNFAMIETFRGLQYHLSWLFNARMMAVRRTLNNEMVVDPSLIEEIDLLDPEPGRLLRLKREAWNSGLVDKAAFPLPVQDVTQSHHTDAKVVTDLIETITGANRLIMGLPNQGRRAATEVQGQLNLASGRMKMLVEIVSSQGMRPWARQMSRNTQAFLTSQQFALKEPYARMLGAPLVQVTPDMIQGDFSFPFNEQGMPTDRLFEANVWKELLMAGVQAGGGAMLAQFLMPIFGRFLRAMGVKDLQTFGMTMQQLVVQPDELVQQQAQQGNLVPAQGANAATPQTMPIDGFALPGSAATPGTGNNGMNA